MSLPAVASKLGMATTVILGAVIGNQVRKRQEATIFSGRGSDSNFPWDRKMEDTKPKKGSIVLDILHKLRDLTAVHGCEDSIANSYTDRAKRTCLEFLQRKQFVQESSELWVQEWFERLEWTDGDDYWTQTPSLQPRDPSTYSSALHDGLTALWFLSSNALFCKSHLISDYELMQILKKVIDENDSATIPLVLRIIANILAVVDDPQPLYQTGLIQVLEDFKENSHSAIFLPAWRGLLNLKPNESKISGKVIKYPEGIYPYVMPGVMDTDDALVDIILIHGIQGGAELTWRQQCEEEDKPLLSQELRKKIFSGELGDEIDNFYTSCWPLDWLIPALGVPVRVLAVDYEATFWHWGNKFREEGLGTVASHSTKLCQVLGVAGVGERPVIWLTHSMGGLIVKDMLMNNMHRPKNGNTTSPELDMELPTDIEKTLAQQTVGVVFYSVPHYGAPLASSVTKGFWRHLLKPSSEIYDMRQESPVVNRLQHSFLELVKAHEISVLTINESHPVKDKNTGFNVWFVPPEYGISGVGEFYEADACHIDICKPVSRHVESYQKVLAFIKDVLQRI